MSSDYDYAAPSSPLPPPPPPAPQHHQASSPHRRIAVQPPILTTALAPPSLPQQHQHQHQQQGATPSYLHGHTPASATSLSVPFSPYVANSPSAYAPSPASPSPMAAQARNHPSAIPYNPQQWGRNGPVGGQHVPHHAASSPAPQVAPASQQPREVTGMEASMPSPPPPYSPGQNQNISQNLDSSPRISGNAFHSNYPPPPPPPPPTSAHPSEQGSSSRPVSGFVSSRPGSLVLPSSATSMTSNPQFPPPPPRNGKERSASREKSKFSLSSFRNRNAEHSPAPSAIENLRINTSDLLSRAPGSPGFMGPRASQQFMSAGLSDRRWSPENSSPVVAPGARRAASAGVLGNGTESRTPVDGSPAVAQGTWEPGMPLPPPPPVPPPSSSRSQSLGRGLDSTTNRQSVHLPAPPTRRPGQSTLGPIPPTPVGWQEEQPRQRSRSPAGHGLRVDTSPQAIHSKKPIQAIEREDVSTSSGPTASTSTNSTLYRSAGTRDQSRGIRERRSESRAARERTEPSNNPWAQDMESTSAKPSDLVLGTPDGGLSRRGAVTKGTPRSAGAIRSPRSSQYMEDPSSSKSTPRLDSGRRVVSSSAPTPPFSPGTDNFDHHPSQKHPSSFPHKALPTPPLHSYGHELDPSLTSQPAPAKRSTSQMSQFSDARPEESSSSTPRPAGRESFANAAIERHRLFIEKEIAAQSDQHRLELFAEFIVAESRLRRDRYSGAFAAMAGDIMDLTRDLWRSHGNSGRRSVTPSTQAPSAVPSGRRSQASTVSESPDARFSNSVPTTAASPSSSVANFTPYTEPASPASASSQRQRDAAWNNNYHPSLSPIPSMAVSTVPDEEDSRGRSASRWWEASNDGASSGYGSRRLERSKRESKYMGLPKEARESLQWAGEHEASPSYGAGSSQQQGYGPNEYPPEKVGLHEEMMAPQPQQPYSYYSNSAPATPDPHKLDVSRLVTLPPPYPRHHPAVNNNHPDLASIRSNLRSLSNLEDVATTKDQFNNKLGARKDQEEASLSSRRAELRYNIEDNVRKGVMSFADAAKAEADFEGREEKRARDRVQQIFDTFQAEVANPLHAMFCERITKVSASIEHLKSRLSSDAKELNPNQTQEEGDEQPELLEMLTLLKWLFEAREQLHKEMFVLEDERNDLYKDIVILPYVQQKNEQKVKEAKHFFRQDAQDRKVTFEKGLLKRHEELNNIIDQNVSRGVEAQLSAFWDIAPGLLAIVQKVPRQLYGFEVHIPPQEFEENPVYHDFPMQYLYSLLAHAGRSAYQFIESQINLLCLLHEVKTGVMVAGSKLLETQRIVEGEDRDSVQQEMQAIREDEERRVTDDLKEKVGLVESQWQEALGEKLEKCKERVESFLVEVAGWDESLKE